MTENCETTGQAQVNTDKQEKITVCLWDSNDQPKIKKSFVGSWLFEDFECEETKLCYSVARTQKGALAVYVTDADEERRPEFFVFEDFEDLRDPKQYYAHAPQAGGLPVQVTAEIASALGIDFEEELDI